MMMKVSIVLGLTAAAGLAAGAVVNVPRADLPDSCTTALANLLSSNTPGLGCIAPRALQAVVFPTNASAKAFGAAVDNWLTEMCAVGTCSADTINQVATQISAGCGTAFGDIPLATPLANLVTLFTTAYPVIRQSMCLKSTDIHSFCLTANFKDSVGFNDTIDLSEPAADRLVVLILAVFQDDCTECAKASFQIWSKVFPNASPAVGGSGSACDANFIAGLTTTPAVGITQTAVNGQFIVSPAANSSGNAAAGSSTSSGAQPESTQKKGGAGSLAVPTSALLFTLSLLVTLL